MPTINNTSTNITYTVPLAWECPRCHRMNVPHVNHCDCVYGVQ